jgi:hypothetical protein
LYNETVIAPPMQMMVPSTLAMPSLLKTRTSSNLHATRNCHSNYIHGPRNPMFSKEYIFEMSQLIDIAISEYDRLFDVLKLETLFSIIHLQKSYVLQGVSIYNKYVVIYYNFSVHVELPHVTVQGNLSKEHKILVNRIHVFLTLSCVSLNMSNGHPFYAHFLHINVIMLLKYVGFKFLMKGNLQNSAV